MSRKLLLPIVGLLALVGVWIWWQQGGVGGPVSDEAARRYFARISMAAQQKDFHALCKLNALVGTCEFDLRIACRAPAGGPIDPGKEVLMEGCRAGVPGRGAGQGCRPSHPRFCRQRIDRDALAPWVGACWWWLAPMATGDGMGSRCSSSATSAPTGRRMRCSGPGRSFPAQ